MNKLYKVKITIILTLLFQTLSTNKNIIKYDDNSKLDFFETNTLDTTNNSDSDLSFDNSLNESFLSKKSEEYADNILEENLFYEIKEKETYRKLQSNYYLNENYKINTAINELYTLSCKMAFKIWLKIFNNTQQINVKNSNIEFKKKLNIFCNNFKLIVKNRFKYFKEYKINNHKKLNLLRLTPYSWLTNEEFKKYYLSNSIEFNNKNYRSINKKRRSLSTINKYFRKLPKSDKAKVNYKIRSNDSYDILFNMSNEDLNNYFNPKKSYVKHKDEHNHLILKKIKIDEFTLSPQLNKKCLESTIKKYPINVKNTKDYSSYLGDVEDQKSGRNCWVYASMVFARAYHNIYSLSKINNLKISYSRIVDCFDDREIIKGLSQNKIFDGMRKYGFSFENNYPNNYNKEFSDLRHKCVANNHKPNIEFKEMINLNTITDNSSTYKTSTIKVDAALNALKYGPYYSAIYAWPEFENCENCSNPPECYEENHTVIVYKIYNGKVYFRNSWGKEWGINGNGAIKAEYTDKNTVFPRKACNLLDYVNIPSFITINNY